MNQVLVIAAHPDDELLGVGATLAQHVAQGDQVSALILGQGLLSREGTERSQLPSLQNQAREAAAVIGMNNVFFADFPDNAFDTVSLLSLVKVVERYLAQIQPTVVYTHYADDLNIDHERTFRAVWTASRPCNLFAPKDILCFETLSSTEWQHKDHRMFRPNVYKNIEATIEKKLVALSAYASEMRPYPHSRSYEGVRILAQYRGLESGMRFAEAFQLVRSRS